MSDDDYTHWRKYTESKTLGVGDMPNPEEDWTVRITKVTGAVVAYSDGPTKKPMIHFDGVTKPLAAAAIVCQAIEKLCGTPNPKKWKGKLITLYADKTDSFGKKGVDCIRVRNVKPKDDAPAETVPATLDVAALLAAVEAADDEGILTALKPGARAFKALSADDQAKVKAAFTARREWLAEQAPEPGSGDGE